MDLEHRFATHFARHNVAIQAGRKSRCLLSISSLWLDGDGRWKLSLNRQLDPRSPEAAEAVMFQLGVLERGIPKRRFLMNGTTLDGSKDIRRAWAWAAVEGVPAVALKMASRWETPPHEIAETLGVTERLVKLRWALLKGGLGDLAFENPGLFRLDPSR